MPGIDQNLYDMLITSIVGKTKGYAAESIGFNHEFPYSYTVEEGSRGSSSISNAKLVTVTDVDQIEAPFLSLNPVSYIGLIAEQPIWHYGPATYNGYNTLNPAINTSTALGYAFMEVQEIPNSPRGGYFTQAMAGKEDPTKYFNGFYWDSYERLQIFRRFSNLKYTTTRTPQDKMTKVKFTVSATNYPIDVLTYITKKATVEKDGIKDIEFQTYLTNENAIYMGENLNTVAWPAVKYFGLFTTPTQQTTILEDTEGHKYMQDQNMYYWGEFEENDNWYHKYTYNAVTWESKWPNLYYKDSSDKWIRNTSSLPIEGRQYYEKLGIIVEPNQGGVFSKNKFQIRWSSDIISNQFTN